ncbi:MAG: RES family NAD+ phosphorylase [Burkholderiaceae bacterium]|nr:RES family NAD+ phosphorylase [Burkholderiaceae bacterium]
MAVLTHRTLRLVRADLAALGMPPAEYGQVNPERTQQIGAAIDYLGCDGLIAPSARWPCDNLMLFARRFSAENKLERRGIEEVAWVEWGRANGLIAS